MSRPRPTSARSLEGRLRTLCRQQGIAEGRARRLLGVVVIGQLLARAGVGVVKGATNLEIRIGTASTRVSSDLDTVTRVALAEFRDTLARGLRDGWEGFTGEVADRGQIAIPRPEQYRPHRFSVKLRYAGGSFTSLTVEVASEEIGALEAPDAVAPAEAAGWMHQLGLPTPDPIPTLPLTHQIAQKLHACTSPDTADWVNDRVHDLIDLQLAIELFDGNHTALRHVATRLYTYRHAHPWPPTVTPRHGWAQRYPAQAEGLDVIQDLDAAVTWTNQLITTIDAANE